MSDEQIGWVFEAKQKVEASSKQGVRPAISMLAEQVKLTIDLLQGTTTSAAPTNKE